MHGGNILLRLSNTIDKLTPEELYEVYGHPNPEPIIRLDNQSLPNGVPGHGIPPVWLGAKSESIPTDQAGIWLADFGESYAPAEAPRSYCNTPDLLVPPEVHLSQGESLAFSADIWTLACTIWTIMGQRPLFEGFHPSGDWMIKEYVEALGKPPSEWWRKWEARSRWFNEEGVKIPPSERLLIDRFEYSIQKPRRNEGMAEVAEQEKVALLKMLRAMLAYKPQDRPTAEQVLEFEWMKDWALPELGRTTLS